jgi:hypothetical protein
MFGSCIIHILYTECAQIKKIIPAPKGQTAYVLTKIKEEKLLWTRILTRGVFVTQPSSNV